MHAHRNTTSCTPAAEYSVVPTAKADGAAAGSEVTLRLHVETFGWLWHRFGYARAYQLALLRSVQGDTPYTQPNKQKGTR